MTELSAIYESSLASASDRSRTPSPRKRGAGEMAGEGDSDHDSDVPPPPGAPRDNGGGAREAAAHGGFDFGFGQDAAPQRQGATAREKQQQQQAQQEEGQQRPSAPPPYAQNAAEASPHGGGGGAAAIIQNDHLRGRGEGPAFAPRGSSLSIFSFASRRKKGARAEGGEKGKRRKMEKENSNKKIHSTGHDSLNLASGDGGDGPNQTATTTAAARTVSTAADVADDDNDSPSTRRVLMDVRTESKLDNHTNLAVRLPHSGAVSPIRLPAANGGAGENHDEDDDDDDDRSFTTATDTSDNDNETTKTNTTIIARASTGSTAAAEAAADPDAAGNNPFDSFTEDDAQGALAMRGSRDSATAAAAATASQPNRDHDRDRDDEGGGVVEDGGGIGYRNKAFWLALAGTGASATSVLVAAAVLVWAVSAAERRARGGNDESGDHDIENGGGGGGGPAAVDLAFGCVVWLVVSILLFVGCLSALFWAMLRREGRRAAGSGRLGLRQRRRRRGLRGLDVLVADLRGAGSRSRSHTDNNNISNRIRSGRSDGVPGGSAGGGSWHEMQRGPFQRRTDTAATLPDLDKPLPATKASESMPAVAAAAAAPAVVLLPSIADEVAHRAVLQRTDRATQDAAWARFWSEPERVRRYVEFLELEAGVIAGGGGGGAPPRVPSRDDDDDEGWGTIGIARSESFV